MSLSASYKVHPSGRVRVYDTIEIAHIGRLTVAIDFVLSYIMLYFLDTDNETVYNTSNDLQRSRKVIGNVVLR